MNGPQRGLYALASRLAETLAVDSTAHRSRTFRTIAPASLQPHHWQHKQDLRCGNILRTSQFYPRPLLTHVPPPYTATTSQLMRKNRTPRSSSADARLAKPVSDEGCLLPQHPLVCLHHLHSGSTFNRL